MRPQRAVLRETGHIALGTVCMLAVMLAVYAVLGRLSAAAVLGGVFGSGVAVLNFFALGMTVQGSVVAIQGEDEAAAKRARAKIQFSYSVRMLAVFGLEVLALAVLKLDALACLLPLIFPRATILVMTLLSGKQRKEGSD